MVNSIPGKKQKQFLVNKQNGCKIRSEKQNRSWCMLKYACHHQLPSREHSSQSTEFTEENTIQYNWNSIMIHNYVCISINICKVQKCSWIEAGQLETSTTSITLDGFIKSFLLFRLRTAFNPPQNQIKHIIDPSTDPLMNLGNSRSMHPLVHWSLDLCKNQGITRSIDPHWSIHHWMDGSMRYTLIHTSICSSTCSNCCKWIHPTGKPQ